MGGGSRPKYSRTKAFNAEMALKEKRIREETISVKHGKGKYPNCLQEKPYPEICPKIEAKDIKNVPKECKLCPEFLESKFYTENFAEEYRREKLKRLKEAGLPLVIKTDY
jgi:hypothetical protein